MKKIMIVSIFFLVFFLVLVPKVFSDKFTNWTIVNNTVFVNDSNVFISATPHTIFSSQWVTFNLTSKKYEGDIDVVFGFDTHKVKPRKIELFNPHNTTITHQNERTIYNLTTFVSTTLPCEIGNEYNLHHYVANFTEKGTDVTNNITSWIPTTQVFCFDDYSSLGNNDYLISWNDTTQQFHEWTDITGIGWTPLVWNYSGMNKWWYITNQPILKNRNYQFRVYMEVPVSLEPINGKYWFAVKPSSETLADAITNQHLYALDPWWNSSWGRKKNLNISNSYYQKITKYPVIITSINLPDVQNDGSDIRIVYAETTVLPFGLQKINNTYWNITLKLNIKANSYNDSIDVFYKNSTVITAYNTSWNENRYNVFDDFNDASISSKWTQGGTPTETGGNMQLNDGDTITTEETFNISIPTKTIIRYSVESSSVNTAFVFGLTNKSDGNIAPTSAGTSPAYERLAAIQYPHSTQGHFAIGDSAGRVLMANYFYPSLSTFYVYNFLSNSSGDAVYSVPSESKTVIYTTPTYEKSCNYNFSILTPAGYTSEIYVDYVKMRFYLDNDITFSVGSEQTSSSLSVSLNSPIDYYNTSDTTPNFQFNFTGSFTGASCEVFINDTGYGINSTVFNNTLTTWTANHTVTEGYHDWKVTCTNSSTSGTSETRYFTVDTSGPTCTLTSITPSNITANSTGVFTAIIDCTDTTGFNQSRYFLTRTVDGNGSIPNVWSARPPVNDRAQNFIDGFSVPQILRADGRGDNKWVDFIGAFSDNFTFATMINSSSRIKLNSSGNSVTINFTWRVEPTAFRSTVFLQRGTLENAKKYDYDIWKNNGILVKIWNLESFRNNENYKGFLWMNIDPKNSPTKVLKLYFCNNSYDPTGSTEPMLSYHCAQTGVLSPTDTENKIYSSANSSYIKGNMGIVNGSLAGIKVTNTSYLYFTSEQTGGKYFSLRYANSSTPTNVSFSNSEVAWTTTDHGVTWTQASFTPDVWVNQIKTSQEVFRLGYYAEDNLGNNRTNFTDFYNDDIGNVDFPISKPSIGAYMQGIITEHHQQEGDRDLNGTYYQNMTIHVNLGIDPEGESVNHSLYLMNTDGTLNYTINNSFTDTAYVHVFFDTTKVPDGSYKMNVTATLNGDTLSFLTFSNFTINQSFAPNDWVNVELLQPLNNSENPTTNFKFRSYGSDLFYSCELLINDTGYGINSTVFNASYGSLTYTGTSHSISSGMFDFYSNSSFEWVLRASQVLKYDTSYTLNATYSLLPVTNAISFLKNDSNSWFVVDEIKKSVYVFNSSWDYTGTFFNLTSYFLAPLGIEKDSDGFFWIAGDGLVNTEVKKFYKNMSYAGVTYQLSENVITAQDLAQDSLGWWWVLDSYFDNRTVAKYYTNWTSTGTSFTIGSEDTTPRGIFFTSSDKLVLVGDQNNKAYEYYPFVVTTITANQSLSTGYYDWKVSCSNSTTTNSSTRYFVISNFEPSISLLSVEPTSPSVYYTHNGIVFSETPVETQKNYYNMTTTSLVVIKNQGQYENQFVEYYFNYTKPAYSHFTSKLQIDDSTGVRNITIPYDCWKQDKLQFFLNLSAGALWCNANFTCWNGNSYENVTYDSQINFYVVNDEDVYFETDELFLDSLICDSDGTSDISNVILSFGGTNSTINNFISINSSCRRYYTPKNSIDVGTYNYFWFANDSSNSETTTASTHEISKAPANLTDISNSPEVSYNSAEDYVTIYANYSFEGALISGNCYAEVRSANYSMAQVSNLFRAKISVNDWSTAEYLYSIYCNSSNFESKTEKQAGSFIVTFGQSEPSNPEAPSEPSTSGGAGTSEIIVKNKTVLVVCGDSKCSEFETWNETLSDENIVFCPIDCKPPIEQAGKVARIELIIALISALIIVYVAYDSSIAQKEKLKGGE